LGDAAVALVRAAAEAEAAAKAAANGGGNGSVVELWLTAGAQYGSAAKAAVSAWADSWRSGLGLGQGLGGGGGSDHDERRWAVAGLHLAQSRCLHQGRDDPGAAAALRQGLQLFPRYARALAAKSALLVDAGDYDAALSALEELLGASPGYPELGGLLLASTAHARRASAAAATKAAAKVEAQRLKLDALLHAGGGAAPPTAGAGGSFGAGSDAGGAALALEPNHYLVLGLPRDFEPDDLKRAYRFDDVASSFVPSSTFLSTSCLFSCRRTSPSGLFFFFFGSNFLS
jgi:tetratricopeptide (TPR) repeat protein